MFVEQISKIVLLVTCVTCAAVYPPKPQFDGRIVGGVAINITQAPWQVSLQLRGTSHFCGGSIINEAWIATAAHCTVSFLGDPTNIKVRAGSSSHSKDGELFAVKRIVQHEKYNHRKTDFDFSLLELEKPLVLDENKQAIKLHNFDEIFPDNTTTLVSGWGSTHNSSESNSKLRAAEVPLVNQKKCKEAYANFGPITPNMICAGFYDNGGKDSCQGDSGGPLVAFSSDDGQPRLVGIVSFGYGCAKPKYPGVYARVLAARNWIYNNTGI